MKLPVATFVACAALWGCKGPSGPRFQRDWAAHPAVVTLTGAQSIDAVGDFHGDPEVAYHLLTSAGVLSTTSANTWAGGQRVVIVTGDVIDKGVHALLIIDLLMALEPQARAAGGRLIVTLGNHEAEFMADPADPKSAEFQAELRGAGLDPVAVAAGETAYGAWLHNLPVAALVDDWFFCHSGDSEGRTAAAIANKFEDAVDSPAGFGHEFLIGTGSILEANAWWQGGVSDVARLDEYLAALPARHIVLGHDPGPLEFPTDPQGKRKAGELAGRYDGRLFLIDVGMSSSVGESDGALLRVQRGAMTTASTVFVDGTTAALWP